MHRRLIRLRRAGVIQVLAVLGIVLAASGAAGADPARPTNYQSRILSVRPALPSGVDLSVAGGDSFLELHVRGNHTVIVPDYSSGTGTTPRPYLRFRPDGTVERNNHAAATAANESRYGTPSGTPTVSDRPAWTVVARNGRYIWHDHRIHWMLPRTPTAVDANGRVDLGGKTGTWTVHLDVDGRPSVVRGELLLLAPPSAGPWVGFLILGCAAFVGFGLISFRAGAHPPYRVVAIGHVAVGAVATLVGWAQWQSTPPGAGANLLSLAVPAVGLLMAAVAAAVPTARTRLVCLAASSAALGGWAFLRREALVRAVLPTSLPFALDRAGTALALGAALGTAALLIWRPPTDRNIARPG